MKKRQEIVTFKVDEDLFEVIKGIPDRSEFIRSAIMAALGGACPLCGGKGVLTPGQKRHWSAFTHDHSLKRCDECNELFLICSRAPDEHAH